MLSRRRERYRYAARRKARQPGEIRTPRVCVERVEAVDVSEVLLCEDPMVLEALRFIKAGARRCLQVEDVAEHVCVSRSTLIRRFKQVLGRSVASEIKRQQVEEVKRLLSETGRSVESISHDCGFSSAGQLSRFFRREVGVSPSEWRRGVRVPGEAVGYRV